MSVSPIRLSSAAKYYEEESHQLAVCRNLLRNGCTVYIELSEFLLPKIQQDLSNDFTNNVKFVKISDLNKNDVYTIDI